MSYEKKTWTNGEVITAEKLNHIEDGIANANDGSSGSSNQNGTFYIRYNDEDTTYIVNDYEEIASKLREDIIPVIAISQNGDVMTLYNIVNNFPNDEEYAILTFTYSGNFNMVVTLEEGNIVIG